MEMIQVHERGGQCRPELAHLGFQNPSVFCSRGLTYQRPQCPRVMHEQRSYQVGFVLADRQLDKLEVRHEMRRESLKDRKAKAEDSELADTTDMGSHLGQRWRG